MEDSKYPRLRAKVESALMLMPSANLKPISLQGQLLSISSLCVNWARELEYYKLPLTQMEGLELVIILLGQIQEDFHRVYPNSVPARIYRILKNPSDPSSSPTQE